MIVSLDIVYRSHFFFLPMRSPDGCLFGGNLITNFIGVDVPVRIPTELVIPHITPKQQVALFCEKISLLENYRDFFMDQRQVVWLNINEAIVDAILAEPELVIRLRKLPFAVFTINEQFKDLNFGRENIRLWEISKLFPLALANFGAGVATTKSIFDGLFSAVMLDKAFIQKQINAVSFVPIMQAIVGQISPLCGALLIAGINDETARQKAYPLGFSAMQGSLWPAVPVESVVDLIFPDDGILL